MAEQRRMRSAFATAGLAWFWISTSGNHATPAVGQRVNLAHGTYVRPASAANARPGGVPRTGGPIVRGGLGGSGNAGGGG